MLFLYNDIIVYTECHKVHPKQLIDILFCMTHDSYEVAAIRAGDTFPLEKAHEAIAESLRTGRKGKVFLEG